MKDSISWKGCLFVWIYLLCVFITEKYYVAKNYIKLFGSGCMSDEWLGRDKEMHWAGCLALSVFFSIILFTSSCPVLYPILCTMLIGLIKEIKDEIVYHGFSFKDLVADLSGACSGVLLFDVFF